jgi:hypothetical protein
VLDIFVQSFPNPARGTWQVTNDGGMLSDVATSRSGDGALLRQGPTGTLVAMSVPMKRQLGGPAPRSTCFRGPYLMFGDGSMGRHYDVAPDGRFLI